MRRVVIVVMLVGICGLQACTSPRPSGQTTATRAPAPTPCSTVVCHWTVGTDPVILVHDQGWSDLMFLTARVTWMEKESCLALVRTHGSEVLIPLWPKGTSPLRARDGRRGVAIPGVGEIFEGGTFSGGGTPLPRTHPAYSQAGPPPGSCGAHDGFFTIDPSGITVRS